MTICEDSIDANVNYANTLQSYGTTSTNTAAGMIGSLLPKHGHVSAIPTNKHLWIIPLRISIISVAHRIIPSIKTSMYSTKPTNTFVLYVQINTKTFERRFIHSVTVHRDTASDITLLNDIHCPRTTLLQDI